MSDRGRRLFNTAQDSEIMNTAEKLEIRMYRLENGRVGGSFEIHGSFGANFLNDEDEELPEADPAETREALQFANGLMRQFSRGRRDGSGDGDGPAFGCCG